MKLPKNCMDCILTCVEKKGFPACLDGSENAWTYTLQWCSTEYFGKQGHYKKHINTINEMYLVCLALLSP